MYFGISFGTFAEWVLISFGTGFGIGTGLVLYLKRKKKGGN